MMLKKQKVKTNSLKGSLGVEITNIKIRNTLITFWEENASGGEVVIIENQ